MHHTGAEPSSEFLARGHRLHQNLDKGWVARVSQQKATPALRQHAEQGLSTGFASLGGVRHRSGTGMPPFGFPQPHSLHGLVAGMFLLPEEHSQISPPAPGQRVSYCHV